MAIDCGIVVVIHTSKYTDLTGLITKQGFGTSVKTGYCDFWMNNGVDQPDCMDKQETIKNATIQLKQGKITDAGLELIELANCRHTIAMSYYISQVKGDCFFVGEAGATLRPQVMAIPPYDTCNSTLDVDYQVNTTTHSFCL